MPDRTHADLASQRGMTPAQVAYYLRVSRGRVMTWIRRRELRAANLSDIRLGRPRYRVEPQALREFLAAREVPAPPKKTPRRRRQAEEIDYYTD
jgi:excisionase family DNA binding protein